MSMTGNCVAIRNVPNTAVANVKMADMNVIEFFSKGILRWQSLLSGDALLLTISGVLWGNKTDKIHKNMAKNRKQDGQPK